MEREIGRKMEIGESDRQGARVVVIQGMADLPGWASEMMLNFLGACELYDPRWSNSEGLEKKLDGLKETIDRANCGEGPVILVGISAGAGLAVEYMLRNKHQVRHLFSVAGVLSPDPKDPKIIRLKSFMGIFRRGFSEMVPDLADRLARLGEDEKIQLGKRITAYSARIEDGKVPMEASEPSWAKVIKIGSRGHTRTIGLALMTDVKKKLDEVREGRFE